MAIPTLITIHGTYLKSDGSPEEGTVVFRSKVNVYDQTSDSVMAPDSIITELDGAGHFSVQVPSTDDPSWLPVNWTWKVSVNLGESVTTFYANIPHDAPGGSLAISALAPIAPSGGTGPTEDLANYIPKSVVTAKGDILAGSSAGVVSKIPVGTNGQVLVADSSEPTGLAWEDGSGGDVSSVAGRTGDVVLTKVDVGLDNVDNTTDLNKPISTATQNALNVKQTLDADLTAIANLAPSNDDFMQRKAGNWTNRTIAEVKTDLALTDFVRKDTATTKGDMYVATAAGTIVRLPVGTNGQVLKANSAVTNGVEWATDDTGAGGGVTSVNTRTGAVTLTSSDVGLGNVTNTSDANKPVSTAQQTALDLKANLASPTFTGTPSLPTGTTGVTQTAADSSTKLATTAFVTTADNLKANLASPTFTGTPSLPTGTTGVTQAAGNSTTALATTAFVTTADNLKANIASPTFTGTPAAPTPSAGTNTTQVATTAFVKTAVDNSATVINIKSAGTVMGDGVTDDTTAINAVIAASPEGATIYFPAGTYIISAPIILWPSRSYVGAGAAYAAPSATTIKLKNGTNLTNGAGLTGMLVAKAWSNNATECDYPMKISNIAINGNRANNLTSTACGIILCNFWTWVVDCYIEATPKHGILLTDTTANGTNVITNSASENRIIQTKINDIGGDGIRQVVANNNSNLDGFCVDNLISYTGGSGLNFDRGTGWTFRRNHFYGIGDSAMTLGLCFATIAEGNYIEDFGGNDLDNTWYVGIGFNQLDGRGTHVVHNIITNDEASPNATHYEYISATANSGQANAQAIIANNIVSGGAGPRGTGIVVQHNSGGTLTAEVLGNMVSNVQDIHYYDDNEVIKTIDYTEVTNTPSQMDSVDQNYIGWSFDPAQAQGGTAGTGGTLYLVKVKVPKRTTITNVVLYVSTAGATLTSNQCFAALYAADGTLLSKTANMSTTWTSTGLKVMALTAAQTVNKGFVYVGFYSVGTTQPSFARASTVAAALANAGLSAGGYRFASANTGITTTMPTTFGTQTSSANTVWAAVS